MKHTRKRSMKRRAKTMKRRRGGSQNEGIQILPSIWSEEKQMSITNFSKGIKLTDETAKDFLAQRQALNKKCEGTKPGFFGCSSGCSKNYKGECVGNYKTISRKGDPNIFYYTKSGRIRMDPLSRLDNKALQGQRDEVQFFS